MDRRFLAHITAERENKVRRNQIRIRRMSLQKARKDAAMRNDAQLSVFHCQQRFVFVRPERKAFSEFPKIGENILAAAI